ncbi:MAG TPA: DHA2 family efflux MFS transporter permease subunit [Thermomicrobiales bacterium]|nr:DHA2 family efflux MFS transporter permease subunit [Thermomicrobiales bacterium]
MATLVAAQEKAPPIQGRERTIALWSLFLALFMELLDATIVNVTLPSIERSLHATAGEQQWMVAAYGLALAIGLMTGARLGDMHGRKRLFVIGLACFTLASLLCGFAQNPEMLIVSRALQGFSSAMMIPQVLSSIQVMYRPSERGSAMAGFSALAGVAAVSGPILGAVLTDADLFGLGWRTIFLVNVPVGIFAVSMAIRLVPESFAPHRPKLDIPGVLVLAVGLLAVLYPLMIGQEKDWPAWTFVSMVVGLAILAGFIVLQRREAQHGGEPLVDLSLFAIKSYAGGLFTIFVFFMAMAGYFLVQTIYMQEGLGFSILRAGLTMIPFSVAVSFFAGLSAAKLVGIMGRRTLQIGPIVMAIGLLMTLFIFKRNGVDTSSWALAVPLFVAGAGMGMVVAPIGIFALSEVPVSKAGPASGLFNTTQQLAGAVGVAIVGTVFFNRIEHYFTTNGAAIQTGAMTPDKPWTSSYEITIWVMVAFMIAAAAAASFLPMHPKYDDAAMTH